MAGISSSGADAAPLSPPPEPPAAEGHGGGAAKVTTFSPLVDLLQRFPDLFEQKVLRHLDPIDRTFLAQAGSAYRAAVVASDQPRAGTRDEVFVLGRSVWVVTHKRREFCTSVERLAWAKANGCPRDEQICTFVARRGRLEVLRWAREHDCPWGDRSWACAANHGHLEVLKWAWEHGCPLTSVGYMGFKGTCAAAAENGWLEMLKWAREQDCSWDARTCEAAAWDGYLEVLQWAREHGCPWDVKTLFGARMSRCVETIEYVRADRCPVS